MDWTQQVHDRAEPPAAGVVGPRLPLVRLGLQDLHPDVQIALVRTLEVALRRDAPSCFRL